MQIYREIIMRLKFAYIALKSAVLWYTFEQGALEKKLSRANNGEIQFVYIVIKMLDSHYERIVNVGLF